MTKFLNTAFKAVNEAEKIVMKYYGKTKKINHKGRVDLVTQADIKSENKIVHVIKNKFPDHGFILEETDDIKNNSEFVWIIDPIDGTTSFAHDYPMFSISIALYKNNVPLIGVVKVPYLNELFYAKKGEGAFLNNKKINVSKTNKIEKSLIGTGFPYSRVEGGKDNLSYFNKIAKVAGGLRRSGSAAIDQCYVACGRLDAYWEIDLKIMDSAAAKLIVEEAGGKYTDLGGKKIRDKFTTIVATNGLIHEKLLKILTNSRR